MKMREPEIKLFGRKIVLPEKGGVYPSRDSSDDCVCSAASCGEDKDEQVTEEHQAADPSVAEESQCTNTSSDRDDDPKTPLTEEVVSENHTIAENEQTDATNQQKTLKKPDKILPCPRCNSMDTKFCYYNNYNVNQPRHFCKSCQRYWTAGGTMRNVPVGAGRRKSKNSASHCGQTIIDSKPIGTVLSFGPDSQLALNPADKIDGLEHVKIIENWDDSYSYPGSSATTPNSDANKNGPRQPTMQTINGVSRISGVPWPVPWNYAVPVPVPAIYPIPFYWNSGMPNAWNVPWLPVMHPLNANQKEIGPNPSSPLGKHSRNGELIKPGNSEKSSIVVPKTLRVDDPEEAAKSSIWSTLGIKYDAISREGLFKALQPKSDLKNVATAVRSPAVLQANPAALSRSINFQESV